MFVYSSDLGQVESLDQNLLALSFGWVVDNAAVREGLFSLVEVFFPEVGVVITDIREVILLF